MDKFEYFWMCVRDNFLPGDISKGLFLYEEIMRMGRDALIDKCNLTKSQVDYIIRRKSELNIDTEYEQFLASGMMAVTVNDDEYPDRLRYIDNRPYALFYNGELPKDDVPSVAVIGSRKCTEYGKYMAKEIAGSIAKEGVNVISGMAYGIDSLSQEAALDAFGKSFGVLGNGVDICYPRVNKSLYDRLKINGGIISEYPVGTGAKADNFPQRNRIISGLSDVVIVVEAKLRSGTFITVDFALSQGREIMVVPGRATDPLSVGCNALISQGAIPAQSGKDVMRLLDTISVGAYSMKKQSTDFRTKQLKDLVPKPSEKILLEREENMVYSVLDFYASNPEDISESVNMDIFTVMNILVSLELKGIIREVGKNMYVRCK